MTHNVDTIRGAAESLQLLIDGCKEHRGYFGKAAPRGKCARCIAISAANVRHGHKFHMTFSPDEVSQLAKPVAGNGGFQKLLREVRDRLSEDNSATDVPLELVARWIRYAKYNNGSGGFQGRLEEGK